MRQQLRHLLQNRTNLFVPLILDQYNLSSSRTSSIRKHHGNPHGLIRLRSEIRNILPTQAPTVTWTKKHSQRGGINYECFQRKILDQCNSLTLPSDEWKARVRPLPGAFSYSFSPYTFIITSRDLIRVNFIVKFNRYVAVSKRIFTSFSLGADIIPVKSPGTLGVITSFDFPLSRRTSQTDRDTLEQFLKLLHQTLAIDAGASCLPRSAFP